MHAGMHMHGRMHMHAPMHMHARMHMHIMHTLMHAHARMHMHAQVAPLLSEQTLASLSSRRSSKKWRPRSLAGRLRLRRVGGPVPASAFSLSRLSASSYDLGSESTRSRQASEEESCGRGNGNGRPNASGAFETDEESSCGTPSPVVSRLKKIKVGGPVVLLIHLLTY